MKTWLTRVLGGDRRNRVARRPVKKSGFGRGLNLEFLEPRMAPAGIPGLLKDVYADTAAGNSNSRAYADVNNVVLFAGRTRQNAQVLGNELWSSQGTPATTLLVKDINPGAADGLDLANVKFVRLGNKVFFAANDGTSGFELWQSDGTSGGTTRLKDINPGVPSSSPNNLVLVGNKIFFWANNGTNGNELWSTDGTAQGTVLVRDINPGVLGSDPQNVTVIGSKIYFGAVVQTVAIEPWVSDGSLNGTILLNDINPGQNSSDPNQFTEVNGVVVFAAGQPATGREIWKTDGTALGTTILKDIVPGVNSSDPTQFTKVLNSVYFVANDDIYITNGTVAGTQLVTATPLFPNYLYNYNNQLIFESDVVGDPSTLRLWNVNGTIANVFAVIPRNSNLGTTRFFGWLNIGSKLIFAHDDGVRGFEPWVTNLTQAGTFNLRDIRVGVFDGLRESDFFARNYAVVGNVAYFVASNNTSNFELWGSNGTTAGTNMIADINPGNFSSDPNSLTVIGTRLYLTMTQSVPSGSPQATGAEPYVMDVSTVGGLFQKTDIVGRQKETGQWFVASSNGATFTTTQIGAWSNSPQVTWSDVLTGDFNGDGIDDIVGRYNETGQWWVSLSDGTRLTNQLWSVWSPASANLTWVDVRVGDFNGDGLSDIVGRYLQTGQWWVGLSNGAQFVTSLWSVWSVGAGVTWADIRVADFNGDGQDDLAGRWNEAGQWYVGLSNIAATQFNTSFWGVWSPASGTLTWVDVFAGDLNNDGKADIIGRINQNGQWYGGLSNGVQFAMSLFATWSSAVNWVDVASGDFNNDGRMDISGRNAANQQVSVGLSSGAALTTTIWTTWFTGVNWVDIRVGDYDGDGFSDIAARNKNTGFWQVSRSNGTTAFTNSNWGAAWNTGVSWVDVRAMEFNGL